MAYNNGFPIGYQQFYPQYIPPQQYAQQSQATMMQQAAMTPPTIHAEILQVDNEQSAENYPVAAGASQMMIKKDDSEIYVKTAFANGQSRLDVYVKRPERPNKPSFDLEGYITRDEFENRLNELLKEVKGNGNVRSIRKATADKSNADDTADQV